MLCDVPGVGLYVTNICKFCSRPIRMMCQQGSGFCCQNHADQFARESTALWPFNVLTDMGAANAV